MESEQVTPALRYREAQCLDCHDKAEGECGTCHTDPANPGTWAPRPASQGVVFSHALHLEASEGKCTPCHAGVEQRTAPSQAARPMDHDTCMSCHRNDFKDIGCKTCHADLVENPSRPTKLFSHDADFMARHGNLAKTELKRFQVRVSDVSKSRDAWKEKAEATQRELAALQAQVQQLQDRLSEVSAREQNRMLAAEGGSFPCQMISR